MVLGQILLLMSRLCSVQMLLLLLHRWAEAPISSLSASEPALLSPSKALCASVKEKEESFHSSVHKVAWC